MLLFGTMAVPATADHDIDEDDGPLVESEFVDGNPTCSDLGDWDYEFKVDEELGLGDHSFSDPDSEFEVDITVTEGGSDDASGHVMEFEANTLVQGVFVKGGPDGNLYDYSKLGGVSADANLHAPEFPEGSGTYSGISHVSFCFDEEPTVLVGEIEVVKTAEGDFDRTIEWELEKSVDPDSHTGSAGEEAGSSTWEVEATKTEELGNYRVSGEIELSTLGSELDAQVDDITDSLGELTDLACELDGESFDIFAEPIPADSIVLCEYTVPVDDDETTNNEVTVNGSFVEGEDFTRQATASFDWDETVIGAETVTLDDDRGPDEEFPVDISDDHTVTYDESFVCPGDPDLYEDGEHQFTEVNVATLTGEGVDLDDEASVDVLCGLDELVVSKTAEGSFDRVIDWDLEKDVDPDSHSGEAGDTFESTWTVTATKSVEEINHAVEGTISIHNPSSVERTFEVHDELDDGTVADVDCPTDTVGAGETVVCDYTAETAEAEENEATVSSPGTEDVTATASVDYTANVIGDEEVTLEDERFDYSETIDETTTVTFDEPFECPTDATLYEAGELSFTEVNVATLSGENTDEVAEADVEVDCILPALEAEKTAEGSFDREITWELDKDVDPASHSGGPGDVFESTWTVSATKSVEEANHEVTGTITVTNPASIAQTFEVDDELDDGTIATVECDTHTLEPGESVVCTYTAETAGAEENTATVTAPGNEPVTATAEVEYTATVIGDEEVTLDDDRNPEGFPVDIDDSHTVNYTETFECPTDSEVYDEDGQHSFEVVNTATLDGPNTDLTASATVTVDCALVFVGETATGAGDAWSDVRGAPNTWFEFTRWADLEDGGAVDIITGRDREVIGTVTGERNGTTTLHFELDDPWMLDAAKSGNVKIHPMDCNPNRYVPPGRYDYQATFEGSTFSVSGLDEADCYAIHLDVGYWDVG